MVAVDRPLRKDHVEPSFIIFKRLICFKHIYLLVEQKSKFSLMFRRDGKFLFYSQKGRENEDLFLLDNYDYNSGSND